MKPLLLILTTSLFAGLLMGQSQVADRSCCRMTIDTSSEPAGLLKISIMNLKQQAVLLVRTAWEYDYTVRLTSADATEPARTEYGRKLLTNERGGSRSGEKLNMNDASTAKIDLGKVYELNPGTYKVVLSRQVIVGGSNVVLTATASFKVP